MSYIRWELGIVWVKSRRKSTFFENFYKKVWKFKFYAYLCNPITGTYAEVAQLVEHNLAKVGVASSSLVFRSKTGHLRMTLNFANHPTGFNHMSVVLVHKVGFFVVNRSPTHLWQGFVLPTEQKRNKQEAWESRKMKSSKAVSEHWILRRICDQISDWLSILRKKQSQELV